LINYITVQKGDRHFFGLKRKFFTFVWKKKVTVTQRSRRSEARLTILLLFSLFFFNFSLVSCNQNANLRPNTYKRREKREKRKKEEAESFLSCFFPSYFFFFLLFHAIFTGGADYESRNKKKNEKPHRKGPHF